MNYIKFLREIGSNFTLIKCKLLIAKLRLEREQSLSYMEFNYMILQAYDFYQLFKKKLYSKEVRPVVILQMTLN